MLTWPGTTLLFLPNELVYLECFEIKTCPMNFFVIWGFPKKNINFKQFLKIHIRTYSNPSVTSLTNLASNCVTFLCEIESN